MKIEYLINKIEELINASSTNFDFRVYDSLKMDKEKMDINKINGIARVVGGGFEPIASLEQGSVTLSVEFIYPYERLEAVNETLQMVAQGSAGLVVANSSFSEDLQGTTGIAITYPIQGNYYNGTMGETAKSRLVCYFDINEKAVLANNIKIEIQNGYQENNKLLKGDYLVIENFTPRAVELPKDYQDNTIYYKYTYKDIDGLPSGYKGLEYIQMNTPRDLDNMQYIDLGFKGNQNHSIELKFKYNAYEEYEYTMGSLTFGIGLTPENYFYYNYGPGSNSYGFTLTDNGIITAKLGKECYYNGELVHTFEDTTFETSQNMIIGGFLYAYIDDKWVPYKYTTSQINVYECKVYDGTTLIKHLVPCVKADGEVGMYDLVNDVFFGNAGSGEFIKGYREINSTLVGKYYVLENGKYKQVSLPTQYTPNTQYYVYDFEKVPFYKYVITRHRLSTTNKYENNPEMQTVNDGQSIDFSLAVPSIKGSVINKIKDDMLLGLNTQKGYAFRFTDESGPKVFENMVASGDFSYDVVPGDTVIFKILFVYKR
jgi:hypothetical protein